MSLSMTARRIVMACLGAVAAPLALAQPASPQFVGFITSGLSGPIGIFNAADESNRLFVIQQGGQVRVWRNGSLQTAPFLSLGSGTTCTYPGNAQATTVGFTSGGERGLLGLAFHPQYESNGRIFVGFTDSAGDTMVVRFTKANPAPPASGDDVLSPADLATCTVILRVDQDFSNHNGGNVAFGPDGFLYVGMGDGGSGGDPCNRAQTLDPAGLQGAASGGTGSDCPADNNFISNGGDPDSRALLGKMLRIDVDGTTATPGTALCGEPRTGQPVAYAIPAGQPSTGSGPIAAACDEVWSYGLRNPWRWSFDRQTGDLLIGDVGQNVIEEVSFEPAGVGGRNYGWRCFEGNDVFSTGVPCASPVVPHSAPVITYSHAAGRCSITGGFRYRGTVQGLGGAYFYADYCTGEVWTSVQGSGGGWSPTGTPFVDLSSVVTSFGEDEAGNLYVTNGSQILLLDGPRIPADLLFASGFEP
jgi:glucose/arabinose dehydrogenase